MSAHGLALILSCGLLFSSFAAGIKLESGTRQPARDIWQYATHKINPRDRDYGAELRDARETLIREWLSQPRCWLEGASAAMLVIAYAVAVYQRRDRLRREIIAAEFLVRYHNALLEARLRLAEAISHNETLMKSAAAASHAPVLADQQPEVDGDRSPSIFLESNFRPRGCERPQKRAPKPIGATAPEGGCTPTDLGSREDQPQRQRSASEQRETIPQKQLAKVPRQTTLSPVAPAPPPSKLRGREI